MYKLRVGVLRGGPSHEYERSLATGAEVLRSMPSHYKPVDVVIDKNGIWHMHGVAISPTYLGHKVDVVVNAMHGNFGEDGKVQQTLEHIRLPYTGSQILPSAMAHNKALAKRIFKSHGIKTPHFIVVRELEEDLDAQVQKIFKSVPMPVIMKPLKGTMSKGIVMAHELKELKDALKKAYEHSENIIVEEYIRGKDATCGVIEKFRNSALYSLIPTAIKKAQHFFSHEEKKEKTFTHSSHDLTAEEKVIIQEMAKKAHAALGLRHYSQSDFVVHPKRGVYLIEVNTLPMISADSIFADKLKAVGSTFTDFLDHIIKLAHAKPKEHDHEEFR